MQGLSPSTSVDTLGSLAGSTSQTTAMSPDCQQHADMLVMAVPEGGFSRAGSPVPDAELHGQQQGGTAVALQAGKKAALPEPHYADEQAVCIAGLALQLSQVGAG